MGLSAGERGGVSASGLMILGDGLVSEIRAVTEGRAGAGEESLVLGGETVGGGGGRGDSFLGGDAGNDDEGATDIRMGVDGTDDTVAVGGATAVEDGGAVVSTTGAGGGCVMVALGGGAGC